MGELDDSDNATQLNTDIKQGERDHDYWSSVFLLACCLLVSGVLLSLILIVLQAFLGDGEMKDDSKATYGKATSSGKSSGGGGVTSTLRQPTPTPVTSTGVQHPVTREQEIIPTPNKGVPPQQPTTLKITPAPPTPAPTTPTTPTKPKPTTTKAPPTTPPVTTTPQSTRPPTTLAPLVDKPPQSNAYICTVASDGEMEMPEDGVCDFTFYESLEKPFERPGETSKGKFATFQSMATKGQKTQFGISIFALDIGAFLIHLSKQSAKAWAQENLWNHNIHHWGIFNIYETIFNQPGYLRNATLSLKRAHDISDPSPTKRVVSYTFLGYYAKQPAGCVEAAEIMKNVYRPTVLVILAHISYTEQEIQAQTPGFECYIMPPTIYIIPKSIRYSLKYGHTFDDAVDLVECMRKKEIFNSQLFAISISLKGRWYTPKLDDEDYAGWGEYSVFKPCKRFEGYGIPQLVCNESDSAYLKHMEIQKADLHAATYDKSRGRKKTLVFDNWWTLNDRFCFDSKYNHDIYDYTIAGYDVNYDYAPSNCEPRMHGSYTRTKLLRFLAQLINGYPRMPPYSCLHADYGELDDSDNASQLNTELKQGERDHDYWSSVFLLACCLLVFGVLLSLILIVLQVFLGDGEMKDDSKATYGKVTSSGKSSGGGGVTSTLQLPTPTPVTSAGVQHPVTREQEIIPTPNKGVPPQQPTTLKITPAPPTPAPTTPTTPTTPKPTTTKAPPTTPSVTTAQSTTPPATLAPLVDKPPQYNAFICTVASDGEMEAPKDGVCDFTFYESLGKPFESPGGTFKGKFATFQSMAAKGQKTQFGISIFALDVGAFLIHMSKQSAKAWAQENLWNHNIHHWGIFNIYETIFNQPGYLRNATLSLKRAHEISDPSPTKRVVSYTFLGYYAKQPAGCDEAAEIMKNVFRPTVLVILGHISYTEQEIQAQTPGFECYIMPPSCHIIPKSIRYNLKYGHTVGDAVDLVKCMRKKESFNSQLFAVSATMKGRWYTPKLDHSGYAGWGEYSVFKPCKRFEGYGIPQLVCNESDSAYLKHMETQLGDLYAATYDKSRWRKKTLVFGYFRSPEHWLSAEKYKITYDHTIAVYDVNYDYAPSNCEPSIHGSYTRTKHLKLETQLVNKYPRQAPFECIHADYVTQS
ncbi:uncharacterized protein [Dermacentor albipictus]|uniref:uncharacterized protein isoform X3 n=1 Tax=Dermacentor albipictus TaxID=60249 RepID=UPI0038FC91F4